MLNLKRWLHFPIFDEKRELNQNLSGNEGCYTACSLLVMLKNSCGILHRPKDFDLILFSYKVSPNPSIRQTRDTEGHWDAVNECFTFPHKDHAV